MAVDAVQHFDAHAQKSRRFPLVDTRAHQPRGGRVCRKVCGVTACTAAWVPIVPPKPTVPIPPRLLAHLRRRKARGIAREHFVERQTDSVCQDPV